MWLDIEENFEEFKFENLNKTKLDFSTHRVTESIDYRWKMEKWQQIENEVGKCLAIEAEPFDRVIKIQPSTAPFLLSLKTVKWSTKVSKNEKTWEKSIKLENDKIQNAITQFS